MGIDRAVGGEPRNFPGLKTKRNVTLSFYYLYKVGLKVFTVTNNNYFSVLHQILSGDGLR